MKEPSERASKDAAEEPADFETAMDKAGFGIFNVILVAVAIPATCASVFATSTMSYILPVAECDLKLTLMNKGQLNAATYAGMIVSAIAWGYLADTLGRKRILIVGYLADAVCVLASSLSQNVEMLITFKFLGGFMVNGPGAVLFTYMSEMHGLKHRPRVLMFLGVITTTATLILPLLAWAIFPREWDGRLFGYFDFHSWQVFLVVCGLPSLISGLCMLIMPESPKFLMSQGRNAEALRSFQKIYAFNTRKPQACYPVTRLIEEVPARESSPAEHIFTIDNKEPEEVPPQDSSKAKPKSRSFAEAFAEGMQQIKPMFRKPILGNSLHVYTMQFCILLGLNTIRLWLPTLFASIAAFEKDEALTGQSANLCTILEYSVNQTNANVNNNNNGGNCTVQTISMDMYTNNIIVGASGMVGYFVAAIVVKYLGTKRLLTYGLFISGALGLSLYWSTTGLSTLIISSFFVTIASIATSSLLGLVVALFPTSLRTLIISIAMMFGRLGALSGNLLFPVFVEIGCIPPFLMVASVLLFAAALSCILPSGKKTTFT